MTIHEPTAAQQLAWCTIIESIHKAVVDDIGDQATDLYDLILEGKAAFAQSGQTAAAPCN